MLPQRLSDTRVVAYVRPIDVVKLDVVARRRDVSRSQLIRDLVRDGVTRALETGPTTPPAA